MKLWKSYIIMCIETVLIIVTAVYGLLPDWDKIGMTVKDMFFLEVTAMLIYGVYDQIKKIFR